MGAMPATAEVTLRRDARVKTGSATLDDALEGGFPAGTLVLAESDAGTGATEFALGLARSTNGARTHFLTALRSAERAEREARLLLEGAPDALDVESIRTGSDAGVVMDALAGLGTGDVLVLESASSIARAVDSDLVTLVRDVADAAARTSAVVVLLHATGTLPTHVEAALAELADARLTFSWVDGGPTRRLVLALTKLRGLSELLEHEQVPIFEVALERGRGVSVSRVKSVV